MADAPATAWPIVKLQTNIPLIGFLKYADYRKGRDWADPEKNGEIKRLPDQIELKGLWGTEGAQPGQARVYVPISFVSELCGMGALEALRENDKDGNPRFQVKNPGRAVRIVKREDGKKKPVFIHWQGEPEGPPAGAAPAQSATAASPAAPAAPAVKDTPQAQRPAQLKTASEIERAAALQLYQSGKAARNRLGEFSTTFEACLQAADVVWERFFKLHDEVAPVSTDARAGLIEKVAVHFSIQMAQEKQHVVPRERLEELKRLAGVTTKPAKEKAPMTAQVPTAPVIDNTPSPLPPSEREPMDPELDSFDEEPPNDDDLPF